MSIGFLLFFILLSVFLGWITTIVCPIKIKPKWLLSLIYVIIIVIAGQTNNNHVFVCLIVMLAFMVIIIFSHFYYAQNASVIEKVKKENKNTERLIANILFLLLFLIPVLFFFVPHLLFLLVFIGFIFWILFINSLQESFLKLERNLPTTKIRSIAMGLVEIKGLVQPKQQFTAPFSKKKCVGYVSTIYQETRCANGSSYYVLLAKEAECHPFYIQDDTGKVLINPTQLDFISFDFVEDYYKDEFHYQEKVLCPGDHVLLIGQCTLKDDVKVIQRDTENNVFAISPFKEVSFWRRLTPLLHSGYWWLAITALVIAFVLTIPYDFHNNILTLYFDDAPLLRWLR